jgi:hypothetical protein
MIIYFVSLSTITSILLYLTPIIGPIIGSIDISSFTTKSIIISFYSTSLIGINCGSLYSLCVLYLFLRQDIHLVIYLKIFSFIFRKWNYLFISSIVFVIPR